MFYLFQISTKVILFSRFEGMVECNEKVIQMYLPVQTTFRCNALYYNYVMEKKLAHYKLLSITLKYSITITLQITIIITKGLLMMWLKCHWFDSIGSCHDLFL